jgi:hypothetical protein
MVIKNVRLTLDLFIHLLSKSVVSKRIVSLEAIFNNKGSIFYDLRMEKKTGIRQGIQKILIAV